MLAFFRVYLFTILETLAGLELVEVHLVM